MGEWPLGSEREHRRLRIDERERQRERLIELAHVEHRGDGLTAQRTMRRHRDHLAALAREADRRRHRAG